MPTVKPITPGRAWFLVVAMTVLNCVILAATLGGEMLRANYLDPFVSEPSLDPGRVAVALLAFALIEIPVLLYLAEFGRFERSRFALFDWIARLRIARRGFLPLFASVLVGLSAYGILTESDGQDYLAPLCLVAAGIIGLTALAAWWYARDRRADKPEWEAEAALAASETHPSDMSAAHPASRLPTITRGEFPNLDAALTLYRSAAGKVVYPRMERLPEALYGQRADACVRWRDDVEVLCFTPKMLETFSSREMLAVLAHLLARVSMVEEHTEVIHEAAEADATALRITRDPEPLISAVRKAMVGRTYENEYADEPWFSDDEAAQPGSRLSELEAHMGPFGVDTKQ